MSVKEKQLHGIILVLAVALASVGGYLVASIQQSRGGQPSQPSSLYTPVRVVYAEQGEGAQLKTIVVSGLGRAAGKPNQAELRLGATTQADNAMGAETKNSEIMNKVIDALKAYIPEKDIETAYFSLYPRYSSYGETIIGFEATHMLKVTTTDLESIGKLIDVAIDAGANRVEGVYFTFTKDKMEELNTLARQSAVADARAKADIVASSLGVKIVGVAGAVEETTYSYYEGWRGAVVVPIPTPAPIMPPTELEVSVVIKITFMIE